MPLCTEGNSDVAGGACHTVLVVAAFLETLAVARLPMRFTDLAMSQAEQFAVGPGGHGPVSRRECPCHRGRGAGLARWPQCLSRRTAGLLRPARRRCPPVRV